MSIGDVNNIIRLSTFSFDRFEIENFLLPEYYTDRGIRKILTKYSEFAKLSHNLFLHKLRHFLLIFQTLRQRNSSVKHAIINASLAAMQLMLVAKRSAAIRFRWCKPIMITIAIMNITFNWNDFLAPLIYLSSPDKYTLQVGIYSLYGGPKSAHNDYNLLFAASILALVPTLLMFALGQKYIMSGIKMTGALKG